MKKLQNQIDRKYALENHKYALEGKKCKREYNKWYYENEKTKT